MATKNAHKVKEINQMLPTSFEVITMNDVGIKEDIVEDGNSFESNASIKSKYLFELLKLDVFGEDSGLEIDALNGAPGNSDNIDLVLENLKNVKNRRAKFISVISLIYKGQHHLFRGEVLGVIPMKRMGKSGFGYDPIFIPEGYENSYAQLGDEIKNKNSHRSKALNKI